MKSYHELVAGDIPKWRESLRYWVDAERFWRKYEQCDDDVRNARSNRMRVLRELKFSYARLRKAIH